MTLSMPTRPNFKTSTFGLETNTQSFESPLSKVRQRVLLGGARWNATYTLPKMNRHSMRLWQAFLLSLEGGVNTFYGFDPDAKYPLGSAGGIPLVNGANQTGSSLITDGWPHSVNGVLLAGDYFGAGGEMKMVMSDVNTDGSGNATINFKPAFRNSPADNAPLTLINPTCTMVLIDDKQSMWQADANGIYNEFTFSAVEVFS